MELAYPVHMKRFHPQHALPTAAKSSLHVNALRPTWLCLAIVSPSPRSKTDPFYSMYDWRCFQIQDALLMCPVVPPRSWRCGGSFPPRRLRASIFQPCRVAKLKEPFEALALKKASSHPVVTSITWETNCRRGHFLCPRYLCLFS